MLRAIEANLAEHDTIVSQLTEKIDRVRKKRKSGEKKEKIRPVEKEEKFYRKKEEKIARYASCVCTMLFSL